MIDETVPFQITSVSYDISNNVFSLMFPSCPSRVYTVQDAGSLDSPTIWQFRQTLLGLSGSTTWTTNNLDGTTNRFFRVVRQLFSDDSDNDGLSNFQEYQRGTNPYNVDADGDGIWDGPFGTNVVGAADYSLSGVPDAFPNDPSRYLNVDSDPFTNMTVAMFKTVIVETNIVNGDTGTELFDVSSRGRFLPYAAGSSAQNGFGHLSGGIYFNHDTNYLYVGVAGLAPGNDNAMLIFLDTDGPSGGVTNLVNMGTLNHPYALTQAHNLSFDATKFTPNVGIIVGDKRRDGTNSLSWISIGNDFGQGVYRLTPTNAVTFTGFDTVGAALSQWGDLQVTSPGDAASTNAANGGIEIAIRMSDLGLTNGATFRAAAIIIGGSDNVNRYFSREAYGESVSGTASFPNDFGYQATTLIGAQVYLSTNPPPAYAPFTGIGDNDVMIQGFYWNVRPSDGTWYSNLVSKAVDLQTNGFTSVWMPPPQKCANAGFSVGYDPYDHYDLGEFNQKGSLGTLYGTRSNLEAAVSALAAAGISPYVDIVMNHMSGGQSGSYTNIEHHFEKTSADFYIGTTNLVCDPFHQQDGGFGDNEVNQTAQHMRYGLEAWGEWLTSVIGFQGYRFDVASSIEPWYLAEWLAQPTTSNEFAVLEHNNGASPRELQTFIQLVDQRARAFDFPLHDKYLVAMCGTGTFDMSTLFHAGLAGIAPTSAVTFVENHDTCRPCEGNDNPRKFGIQQDKILAYAYILISEGYPCVFYHDYYQFPNADTNCSPCVLNSPDPNNGFCGSLLTDKINKLIQARKLYASGTTTFISDGNLNNVYVVRRTGGGPFAKSGCVLAINRAATNISVTVNTGFSSTNLIDRVDTATSPFSTNTTSSGTATFSVPGRGYRVLAP